MSAGPLSFSGTAGLAMSAFETLHGSLSGMLGPISRNDSYVGNSAYPNVIPPIDVLIDAYNRGHIKWDELRSMLLWHGVSMTNRNITAAYAPSTQAWNSFILSRWRRPDITMLIELAARGFFGDVGKDGAGKDRWNELRKWSQFDTKDWKEFTESLNYTLTPDMLAQVCNRGLIPKSEYAARLQAVGVVSSAERQALELSRMAIPSPQEMAIMARRFAFADDNVITTLGLDAHLDDKYLKWAKATGLGEATAKDPETGNAFTYDFAKGFWRIHWNTIAPGQAAIFRQRLREGRDNFGVSPEFKDLVFPLGDDNKVELSYNFALRDAGYTPPWRPFLEAVSYRTLGIRQISQIHYSLGGQGKLPGGDKEWVTQRYQDNGLTRDSAETLADTVIRQNAEKKARAQLDLTRAKIEESWIIGVINSDVAKQLLTTIGLTPDEASAAVSAWELARATKLAVKLIQGFRRNYLLGDVNAQEVTQGLTAIGIEVSRIQDYLQLWDTEQRQYRLERGPATLTKWLVLGTITVDEMEARLTRIGWATEDVERIILAALATVKTKPTPKGKGPKGKLGRLGEQNRKDLSSRELRAMFQAGIIKASEAVDGLRALNYDDEDITRLMSLWSRQVKLVGET